MNDAHLDAAEAELGHDLPLELRARWLRENGGELETKDEIWQLHPVFDDTTARTKKQTARHFVRETIEARRLTLFPAEAISIAHNSAGDRLIFLPEQSEFRIWRHDTGGTELLLLDLD